MESTVFSLKMVLFLCFGLLIWALFNNFYWKRRNYPPGPTPVPFLGNSPQLFNGGKSNEDIYIGWRKKYGDVYTIWMGGTPVITVNGYKAINDHFVKDADSYSGRFASDDFYKLTRGGNVSGIIGTEGNIWAQHRRFALRIFKDFGLGKNLMQEQILTDVADLIRMIGNGIESGKEELNIREMIEMRVGSIINVLLLGYRFDETQVDEFKTVKERIAKHTECVGNPLFRLIQSNVKLFRHIPVCKKFLDNVHSNIKSLMEFFNKQVEDHLKELDFDSDLPASDFVEAYLRYHHKMKNKHQFGRYDMLNYHTNLASNLCNSTSRMSRENVRIRSKIGSDRLIVMSDRPNLPYTCAVVNETLRVANLLPLNLPHKTLKDVKVNGYKIKKGTVIVPQISTVLYDENVFKNAHEFIPERHLDENGQLKTYNEFVPFSMGKRQCLGEGLARMEMFLFTANLFNQFEIKAEKIPPDSTRKLGGTANCNPFLCSAEHR